MNKRQLSPRWNMLSDVQGVLERIDCFTRTSPPNSRRRTSVAATMLLWPALAACILATPVPTFAGSGKVVREGVEMIARTFGKEVVEEGGETLARRLATFVSRHGEDGVQAAAKVGPAALRLSEQAGEAAPQAVRLMARRGEDAVWVVGNKNRLAIFVKHGDGVADAMLKHRGVADSLITAHGSPAARALDAVGSRSARRLAMLDESGELARIGRTEPLLEVVERHGDRAADFIWRNKGALTVGAALTAFLSEPEPFLDGARSLAETVTTSVAQPIAQQVARQTNWTAVVLVGLGLLTLLITWTTWRVRWIARRPELSR